MRGSHSRVRKEGKLICGMGMYDLCGFLPLPEFAPSAVRTQIADAADDKQNGKRNQERVADQAEPVAWQMAKRVDQPYCCGNPAAYTEQQPEERNPAQHENGHTGPEVPHVFRGIGTQFLSFKELVQCSGFVFPGHCAATILDRFCPVKGNPFIRLTNRPLQT